jgi:hypothetical protein
MYFTDKLTLYTIVDGLRYRALCKAQLDPPFALSPGAAFGYSLAGAGASLLM